MNYKKSINRNFERRRFTLYLKLWNYGLQQKLQRPLIYWGGSFCLNIFSKPLSPWEGFLFSHFFCMKIGIVWATGAVGQELIPLLERRKFPVTELRLFGSKNSEGKILETPYGNRTAQILSESGIGGLDALFFAASSEVSAEWCPRATKQWIICIDKSSRFRMDPSVPLVVPEVNSQTIGNNLLIANPNCTTSIAAVVLWPLHEALSLRRVIMSTYQAASGAGKPAMEELENATCARLNGEDFSPQEFSQNLAFNLIPHIDNFTENAYTKEEMKVTHELRKILWTPHMPIECTAVRVPILRAHSESITIETEKLFVVNEVRKILGSAPGVEVVDDPAHNIYPMPSCVEWRDNVHVGRIRQSLAFGDHGGTFFVSGDQLLKWAALNAAQILEYILKQRLAK